MLLKGFIGRYKAARARGRCFWYHDLPGDAVSIYPAARFALTTAQRLERGIRVADAGVQSVRHAVSPDILVGLLDSSMQEWV